MKKLYFSAISIVFLFLFYSGVYAANEGNAIVTDTESKEYEEQLELQKKDTLKMIDECVLQIKDKLLGIDNKIRDVKSKQEYKNFPGIRLNIDTPMFGIISVIEQKLKITSDVSTVDFAGGYSIKDIIKNNNIKLPSFAVGSVTVVTRDVKLDDTISVSDANTALLKLMQFVDQTDNTKKFLDEQINNIFSGYISEEKSTRIRQVENKLNELSDTMIKQDKSIVYLSFMHLNNDKYTDYINIYSEIENNIYSFKDNIKNVLITDEELKKVEDKVSELNIKINEFAKELDETTKIEKANVNVENILIPFSKELTKRKDDVKIYLDSSVKKVEEENKEEKGGNIDNKNTKKIIETKIYDTTSKGILDYMLTTVSYVEQKIEKYINSKITDLDENLPPEVISKGEVNAISILSYEEKLALVDELYDIYSEFISKENKFYLDNLNYLLKDSSFKISEIGKYTNKNALKDMKYIYSELPKTLDNCLELNNLSSINQTKRLTISVKEVLVDIVNSNISVNKIYNQDATENLFDAVTYER